MKTPIYSLLIMSYSLVTAASTNPVISVRKINNSKYELTITVLGANNVGEAQKLLQSDAQRVCKNKSYQMGRYSFDSREKLGIKIREPQRFTLRQDVTCSPETPIAENQLSYEWSPTRIDDQEVMQRTVQYLALKDKGQLKAAYGQFSDVMKESARFDTWAHSVQMFNDIAGKVEFRKILKISWVKDPSGVAPGFYAAVDYAGRFQQVPFECGYVAWYRDIHGTLTIMREEESYIDEKSRSKMTADEVQQALAKFGCSDNQ